MLRPALSVLLLAALALLGGCATEPRTPPADRYQPPPTAAANAVIRGTEINEPGLFGSRHAGYVVTVDRLKVDKAEGNWDSPLVLAPGKRAIGVEYHVSNFHAQASLALQARPGALYQLKIKPGREYQPDGPLCTEFWIEDASTGQPVTEVAHRQLTGGKKGTIFYMNK